MEIRVDVWSPRKAFCDIVMVAVRCVVQRREALVVSDVKRFRRRGARVGRPLEQQVHDGAEPALRSEVQCSFPLWVLWCHVGASREKDLNKDWFVVHDGEHQRCVTLRRN